MRIFLDPISNPVTREPEQVTVNHGTGFIFKTAECASARDGSVGPFPCLSLRVDLSLVVRRAQLSIANPARIS